MVLLIAGFIFCVSSLAYGVILRRRRGESWNQALAGGTKLMTGSVWLDGALFAGIMLAILGVIFRLLLRA
jgi:hypothetical protein